MRRFMFGFIGLPLAVLGFILFLGFIFALISWPMLLCDHLHRSDNHHQPYWLIGQGLWVMFLCGCLTYFERD